jgi:hypothetical protein
MNLKAICISVALVPAIASEVLPFADVKIGTNIYRNARIRKAGPESVILSHDGGFFSVAITNLPETIRTNFPIDRPKKWEPSKEVKDYIAAHPQLDPIYRDWLTQGKETLRTVESFVQRDKVLEIRRAAKAELRRQRDAEEAAFNLLHPDQAKKFKDLIAKKKISIGMRSFHVIDSWGQPDRKNETTTERGTNSQWVYGVNHVYFNDGGFVSSISTSSK